MRAALLHRFGDAIQSLHIGGAAQGYAGLGRPFEAAFSFAVETLGQARFDLLGRPVVACPVLYLLMVADVGQHVRQHRNAARL